MSFCFFCSSLSLSYFILICIILFLSDILIKKNPSQNARRVTEKMHLFQKFFGGFHPQLIVQSLLKLNCSIDKLPHLFYLVNYSSRPQNEISKHITLNALVLVGDISQIPRSEVQTSPCILFSVLASLSFHIHTFLPASQWLLYKLT